MSCWRMLAHRLYKLGGTAPTRKLDDGTFGVFSGVARIARVYGLIQQLPGRAKNRPWTLTEKGKLFCEGKIVAVNMASQGGMKFRATWLLSLPQLSIN